MTGRVLKHDRGYTAGFAVYPGRRSRAKYRTSVGFSSRLAIDKSAQVTGLFYTGRLLQIY